MKKEIKVYKVYEHQANIEQTKIQRDWLEDLQDRHGYKCFPMALANTIGWTLSLKHDVEFEWDGIVDTSPDHVKIYKGGEGICHANRGNATISFDTGLIFKTDKNTSLLSIPTPNNFIDGITPYTNIISSSFFDFPLPVAWRITKPNYRFFIKAGDPIITIIPISIKNIMDYEVGIYNMEDEDSWFKNVMNYNQKFQELSKDFGFSNFYRNAVDHTGNSVGSHEVTAIRLKTTDYTKEK